MLKGQPKFFLDIMFPDGKVQDPYVEFKEPIEKDIKEKPSKSCSTQELLKNFKFKPFYQESYTIQVDDLVIPGLSFNLMMKITKLKSPRYIDALEEWYDAFKEKGEHLDMYAKPVCAYIIWYWDTQKELSLKEFNSLHPEHKKLVNHLCSKFNLKLK